MFSLEFKANSFDVIWSEGAIHIIGFQRGLQTWKPLLKSGGYLVVSELSWLKPNPPTEVKQYWQENYQQMKMIASNLQLIEQYSSVKHFSEPRCSIISSWTKLNSLVKTGKGQ